VSSADASAVTKHANKGDDIPSSASNAISAVNFNGVNFQKAQETPGSFNPIGEFYGKREQMEGVWYIRSVHNNLVLDVRDGNVHQGTNLILNTQRRKQGNSQQWIFTNDHYIASAVNPNLVLDIEGGGKTGTKIILWDKKSIEGASNQRWNWATNGIIENLGDNNLVFDVEGESRQEGSCLIVWCKKAVGASNQTWTIEH